MRILFSVPPTEPHALPLLPIGNAARAAGHDTVFLTHSNLGQALAPHPIIDIEPPFLGLRDEAVRISLGGAEPSGPIRLMNVNNGLTPDGVFMLFVRARMKLSAEASLHAAREYAPDLIVGDAMDAIGPFLAAALEVPWVAHALGMYVAGYPETFATVMQKELEGRGLQLRAPIAQLDPWPELLQPEGWVVAPNRIVVGPEPGWEPSAIAAPSDHRTRRPSVLVSLGVTADETAVEEVVDAVVDGGADAVVTARSPEMQEALAGRAHVQVRGFTPLAQLLPDVDVVVCAAGAGTVLATLRHARPMIMLPLVSEQPLIAAEVSRAGAGITIEEPRSAGPALRALLDDPAYATAAHEISTAISKMDPPSSALDQLLSHGSRLASQSGPVANG